MLLSKVSSCSTTNNTEKVAGTSKGHLAQQASSCLLVLLLCSLLALLDPLHQLIRDTLAVNTSKLCSAEVGLSQLHPLDVLLLVHHASSVFNQGVHSHVRLLELNLCKTTTLLNI